MDFYNSTFCDSLPIIITITAFSVAHVLFVLPLLVFVLFLGCQRWFQSSSSMLSHPDVFTYNMVAMEMIQILSNTGCCVGIMLESFEGTHISRNVAIVTLTIKTEFLLLTCVELYLAIVFPIIYLRHKNSAGVTLRNMSICWVWINWIIYAVLYFYSVNGSLIVYFFHSALLLLVICFCCISVLWTLTRSSPGNRAKDKEKVDQSKLKAFYIILIIMTVLLLSLGGVLVCDALDTFSELRENTECFAAPCSDWMTLLSSLVLPLLFLQRAGKLPSCKTPNQGNKSMILTENRNKI